MRRLSTVPFPLWKLDYCDFPLIVRSMRLLLDSWTNLSTDQRLIYSMAGYRDFWSIRTWSGSIGSHLSCCALSDHRRLRLDFRPRHDAELLQSHFLRKARSTSS